MERKIVLVDDHSLFRNGLRGLLERCAGCRVVGEAASGEEFLAMLPGLETDVVFMDFAMPGLDGAQTTERALARRPDLRIITLSMFGEESYYSRMVQAGARGFLLKDSDIGDVIEVPRTVQSGDRRRTVYFEAHGGQAPGQHSRKDRLQEHRQSGRLRHPQRNRRNLTS